MADDKDRRKPGERRPNAQRLKRVHADTSRDSDENELQSLESLRARVTALGNVHTQLRDTLSKPVKINTDKLCQEFEEARSNDCAGTDLPSSAWTDALLEAVFEKAHSESHNGSPGKILYHIDQKTIFLLPLGRVGIQFETAYQGVAHESFYCILTTKPPSEKISINKDSFPFFLNTRELEKMHLPSSAAKFIDHINNALQAYVSRREQIIQLKQLHGNILGGFYQNLANNLLDFYLEEGSKKIEVNIAYDNLDIDKPTRSRVNIWFGNTKRTTGRRGSRSFQAPQVESRRLVKAEEALRFKPLPEAMDDFLREVKIALEELSMQQLA